MQNNFIKNKKMLIWLTVAFFGGAIVIALVFRSSAKDAALKSSAAGVNRSSVQTQDTQTSGGPISVPGPFPVPILPGPSDMAFCETRDNTVISGNAGKVPYAIVATRYTPMTIDLSGGVPDGVSIHYGVPAESPGNFPSYRTFTASVGNKKIRPGLYNLDFTVSFSDGGGLERPLGGGSGGSRGDLTPQFYPQPPISIPAFTTVSCPLNIVSPKVSGLGTLTGTVTLATCGGNPPNPDAYPTHVCPSSPYQTGLTLYSGYKIFGRSGRQNPDAQPTFFVATVYTDAQGRYDYKLPPGTYTVEPLSLPCTPVQGYKCPLDISVPSNQVVSITAGQTTTLDLFYTLQLP